jgi:hypothetical protein
MYFIFKIMFCEYLWHDPNYFICVYRLLYILIELLHYLPKKLHCFEDPWYLKTIPWPWCPMFSSLMMLGIHESMTPCTEWTDGSYAGTKVCWLERKLPTNPCFPLLRPVIMGLAVPVHQRGDTCDALPALLHEDGSRTWKNRCIGRLSNAEIFAP